MLLLSLCTVLVVSVAVALWFLPKSSVTGPVPVGAEGRAVETFAREGFVLVRGELWRAHTHGGVIEKGDVVVVVGYNGSLAIEVVRKE